MRVCECVCDSVRPIHRPLKNPSKLHTQRNWPHRNHETCRIFLRKIRQSITGACQTKEIDDYTGWTMNVGLRVVSGMQSRCSCERLSLVQKWPFWYGNWMFSFICALIRSFKHSSIQAGLFHNWSIKKFSWTNNYPIIRCKWRIVKQLEQQYHRSTFDLSPVCWCFFCIAALFFLLLGMESARAVSNPVCLFWNYNF